MKTFFINTATLKLYINVTGTFDYDALMPYVKTAQDKYIKKYLGKDLFDSLLDYYNADEAEPDEALDALLPYVQNALAKFAFYAAVPLLTGSNGRIAQPEFGAQTVEVLFIGRFDNVPDGLRDRRIIKGLVPSQQGATGRCLQRDGKLKVRLIGVLDEDPAIDFYF